MRTLKTVYRFFAALTAMLLPSLALAQDDLNGANTAWILTSTALVLFMTLPGLSLFYGGLVRTKNVLSVLMQCFSIAVVISILWLLVGYSIAFGPSESAYWRPQPCAVCRHRSEFNVRRHSGNGLRCLSNDLCDHHTRADRRRFRGTHQVFCHAAVLHTLDSCLLYTSPSPRDA